MILYCSHISSRLRYIVDFIGHELFEEPIILTSDKDAFINSSLPRLNYSDAPVTEQELFIKSTPLLFQSGTHPQDTACFEWNGYKAFFPTAGDFPFDILAASFYLISRYEEYLPHDKDGFGRYAHTGSLASREGFLDIPLVNIWLKALKQFLSARYPGLLFRYPAFKFIPTYDIDIAWSYLHKGWKRNTGGWLRSFAQGRWREAKERMEVLRGRKQDPYDAYEWLDSLHLYCRLKPYYFFLVAGDQKGVDKNISPMAPALQELVRYHAAGYRVGIHPSWQSGDNEKLLKEEIEWLEWITDRRVTQSRQHYIRFTLPHSYRKLIQLGIEQDFSMGYGTINGFRASVASSYYWYDLEKEESTSLRIFPFCFMDANSFFEQGYSSSQAMKEMMHYYHQVRKVNGLMITIWHNSFLGTDPLFTGWKEAYEIFLKEEVYWAS